MTEQTNIEKQEWKPWHKVTITILSVLTVGIFLITLIFGDDPREVTYTIENEGEFGIAAEPGYKFAMVLDDHTKYSMLDLRYAAAEAIKDVEDGYIYKKFTVFIDDPDEKFLMPALFRFDTDDSQSRVDHNSFTIDTIHGNNEPVKLRED